MSTHDPNDEASLTTPSLESLSTEEAVNLLREIYGMDESNARVLVAQSRGPRHGDLHEIAVEHQVVWPKKAGGPRTARRSA